MTEAAFVCGADGPLLQLNVEFSRGNFSLQVHEKITAPVTGLFGPSGCGKSTLLALIAGLLKPERGHIILQGRRLFDSTQGINLPPHQRHVGLVFQDGQLFPHLNLRNNLLYGYRNLAPEQRRFELDAVVDLLELAPLLTRKPRQLSGGEQQRVALGRALLYSPSLLLLDEPLSALDKDLKSQILPFLARLRDAGIPMLYVTHSFDEIRYLTDKWLGMEAGRMVRT
jgi:molybdate transport system ATP-binding protein